MVLIFRKPERNDVIVMWKAIKDMCVAIWRTLIWVVEKAGKAILLALISIWITGAVVVYGSKMDLWPMPDVKYDPDVKTKWVMQGKTTKNPTYLPSSHWWRPDDGDNPNSGKFTLRIGAGAPTGFNSVDELNKELEQYGRMVVAVEVKSSPPYFKVGFKVVVQILVFIWDLVVGLVKSIWIES